MELKGRWSGTYSTGLFHICRECTHIQLSSISCNLCTTPKPMSHTIPRHVPKEQWERYLRVIANKVAENPLDFCC